jgi:hypothetical protein
MVHAIPWSYVFRMKTEVPNTLGVVQLCYTSLYPYTPISTCVKNLRNPLKTHYRWYGRTAPTASWSGRSVGRNKPRWFGSGVHSKRAEAVGGLPDCSILSPKSKLNKHRLFTQDYIYHIFYMIQPLAEISYWNPLMTCTLEFWKIK